MHGWPMGRKLRANQLPAGKLKYIQPLMQVHISSLVCHRARYIYTYGVFGGKLAQNSCLLFALHAFFSSTHSRLFSCTGYVPFYIQHVFFDRDTCQGQTRVHVLCATMQTGPYNTTFNNYIMSGVCLVQMGLNYMTHKIFNQKLNF